MSDHHLRLAFVPGCTPDKWAHRWRERRGYTIDLIPIEQAEQRRVLDERRADLVLARLPLPTDDLHAIRLYEELPVAVVANDHPAAAYAELAISELADEQFALGPPDGFTPHAPQLDFPPMSAKDAIEVAASGTAIAVLPMSIARLWHRKDVAVVNVSDLPSTQIVMAWPKDHDGDLIQEFVGVVRGRTTRSSR